MTRVFLTGHSGFIGTYFLRYFENYFKIITFKKRINKENYSDLLNFESANVVVHAAAKTSISSSWSNPEKMIENNIFLTKSIIDYCLKNNAFLIYISSYLYGEARCLPTPETAELKINNPYSQSKKICEEICLFHRKNSGLNVTLIRPFNIYGYFKSNNQLIMTIINQITKKKEITVSDLNPRRDWLYIKDFCDLLKIIINKMITNEIFNAGSGKNYSVDEIIQIIQELYPSNLPVNCLNEERKNEIFETRADISKAKKLLKWEPVWTIEEGINDTLKHLQK